MWAPAVTGHICSVLFTGIQTRPQWRGFVRAESPNILICAPQSTALFNFSPAATSDLSPPSAPRPPPSPLKTCGVIQAPTCCLQGGGGPAAGLPAHHKAQETQSGPPILPSTPSDFALKVPGAALLTKSHCFSPNASVNRLRGQKVTETLDVWLGVLCFLL